MFGLNLVLAVICTSFYALLIFHFQMGWFPALLLAGVPAGALLYAKWFFLDREVY